MFKLFHKKTKSEALKTPIVQPTPSVLKTDEIFVFNFFHLIIIAKILDNPRYYWTPLLFYFLFVNMFVLQILTLAAVARAISNDPATEIKTVQGLVGRVLGEVGSLLVQ